MKRILVAVDGSSLALRAAAEAARLCKAMAAHLSLLHVGAEVTPVPVPDLDPLIFNELPPVVRDEQAAQAVLDKAAATVRAEGIEPEIELRWIPVHGSVAQEIVRAAQEGHHDLIVLGPRGRANVLRFLVGSVSAAVFRHAHCSVLIVRGADAADGEQRHARSGASEEVGQTLEREV